MAPSPVAIVTGAGSGIGRAVAIQLMRRGWRAALVGRREGPLCETAEAGLPSRAIVCVADLADPDAPARIVAETVKDLGRIDAVVNNAAVAPCLPIGAHDRAVLERTLAIDTIAPALLVIAAGPELKRHRGVVVNVSSLATVDPFPGFLAYAAAKCGLESQVRSIRNEWGGDGVRAYAVAPGAVETAMLRGFVDEREFPASRTLPPETVAEVVVACILDERDEPSGSTIVLPSPD